ncbi:LOW QUALITY PROTEIN: ATP-binding cassette sub-family B member 6-like [Physella acuta]|uniref:LOW QUALITY PROTEIN: ATP-binding cassette sub-family B member 6-like n=1 Tax=Physella acuta TaxID=109671 RepID=UPI0027DE09D2|nr:LOW QUALITY PROTEIN: ATP-binding cassette sub-family B member 6-like [Physella acuta]
MQFCPNESAWQDVWVNNGFTRCFFQSTSASVVAIFILVSAALQTYVYSKHALKADKTRASRRYSVQVLCTILIIIESVLHLAMSDVYLTQKTLYGFQVLEACTIICACIMSLWLLAMERRSMLPSLPTRGQGLVLLLFYGLLFVRENLMFISWNNPTWWWKLQSQSDAAELGLFVVRYVLALLLLLLAVTKTPPTPYMALDDQEGSNSSDQKSTWDNSLAKVKLMLPYVWPKGSITLQLTVGVCLCLLVLGRVINVFVPLYSKDIVNSMTYPADSRDVKLSFRWDYILIYVTLIFLKGGTTGASGLVSNLNSFLWVKVQQFSTRTIQIRLFTHLHNLSLRWHLGRKTGEMLRVVDRGTNSINTLLSYVLFQVLPTIADIVIAIIYFVTAFNYLFGLIVFFSMALYLAATVQATEWRTKYRRLRNQKDNEANAKAVDSLLNFETVKYYAATDWEMDRYQKAIIEYQLAEWKFNAIFNLLSLAQNSINTAGLAAGALLCAWAVTNGINDLHLNVGDYVLFGTYVSQLYGPLNTLGNTYRMIQQAFIDMENMFDLLEQGVEVKDEPGAPDLKVKGGEIEFKNVSFTYEYGKMILKNVSFKVPSGHTYALVGHTGSGKSTVVRLLFRFYDVQDGCILIDGQDIAKVTQVSLRSHIGVVPQDTVLFNNDIRYNIRYGKLSASDEEVEEAARAAEIHNRILTFPKQYETVVGERGLRLSGGEKQRVAIARTLLKAPAIVLLDEATSALDTKTERSIQSSLARVCENRTTLIVAHRLSTIIHAHQIIVLNEGQILEMGTHAELVERDGHYADMWRQQLIQQEKGEITAEETKETKSKRGRF